MKRRDTFRLIPLTLASIGGLVNQVSAFEQGNQNGSRDENLPLALQYQKNVIDMLTWVKENQSENILEASYAIARTVLKGNTFWCHWDLGHSYSGDIFPDRNGQPEILTPGYNPEKSKPGDLLLDSRAFRDKKIYDDLVKKDIFVIGAPAVWGADAKGIEHLKKEVLIMQMRPFADIWIETPITTIGAMVKIPGMPAPIGPVSGPLYTTMLWMILADTCRILALEGKPVKVKGDEPKLSGDNINWVDMADPLMDNFLFDIMLEMEVIGGELGDIRNIANMAVDTLLDGGTVYFYSRYREALASEAYNRRGGFRFAQWAYDGHINGTSKDCVIMGIYKPDDDADLKNLDDFKKRGMRVASIGPITRDFKIPDGRTVPKESEAHIGRMCDTYGLFAIPGFDKKVCPTSGILNITMLWCLSIEIAEQIIKRTNGNVPVTNYSGALKWSSKYYIQLRAMMKDRGY